MNGVIYGCNVHLEQVAVTLNFEVDARMVQPNLGLIEAGCRVKTLPLSGPESSRGL